MELFSKATQFCGSEPTAKAKSMLALSSAKMLFALENRRISFRNTANGSKNFSSLIPITTCSVPSQAPDPSLLRAC
jgi:hypothetical protein